MKKLSLTLAAFVSPFSIQAVHANDQELERFVEARLLEINDEEASALERFEYLFSKASDSETLADRLFDISLREGDVDTALKALEKLENNVSIASEVRLLRFASALKKRNWRAAQKSVEALKKDRVFSFMAPIMGSWIEIAQGKDGETLLDTSKNTSLTNFYANDQIIYQYLVQKKFKKVRDGIVSVRPFNEVFARDLILTTAAILYNDEKAFAEALLEAQGSESADTLLRFLKEKPSKSKRNALTAVSVEIGVARLYARVSATLVSQDLYETAVFFARTAHWLAPQDRSVALHLANALEASQANEQASSLLEDIEAWDPYYPLFQRLNIQILVDSGQYQDAVDFAKAINKSGSVSSKLLLAQAYVEAKQYKEAELAYRDLIENSPDASNYRKSYYILYLARSLNEAGDWERAKSELENGLKLETDNPFLLNYYGYSLLERGEDIERGFKLVEQAYKLEPDSPDITDSLGWGHFLKGELDEALPLLEKAASTSPQDHEIKEHLGDAYWKLGRLIDARYIWRAAALIADDEDKNRLDHKVEFGLDIPHRNP